MKAPAALAGARTGAQRFTTRHLQNTTLDELLQRTRISEIWQTLGGGDLKRTKGGWRGRAFWRDGDGLNVRVTERSVTDYVTGESFGILSLIEAALSCSRREAVAWLASFHGVSLERQRPAQTREWAQRRQVAEREADDLLAWREQRLEDLRRRRNVLFLSEGTASAAARVLIATDSDDETAWAAIWQAAQDDLRGDEIQHEVDRLAGMSPTELAAYRARCEVAT